MWTKMTRMPTMPPKLAIMRDVLSLVYLNKIKEHKDWYFNYASFERDLSSGLADLSLI